VDISKEYDDQDGFYEELVDLMMACVTTVLYKVGFNYSLQADNFKPSKGLR